MTTECGLSLVYIMNKQILCLPIYLFLIMISFNYLLYVSQILILSLSTIFRLDGVIIYVFLLLSQIYVLTKFARCFSKRNVLN
jgi:hypothetical protein